MPKLPKSPYGPFSQIDFPATLGQPAGSTFDAVMPVDLRQEQIDDTVTRTIPDALSEAFLHRESDFAEYMSTSGVPTLRIIRELGLMGVGPLSFNAERQNFQRCESAIGRLSTQGVSSVHVRYYLDHGNLIEYSVAGSPHADSEHVDELFASIDHKNAPNQYYYRKDVAAGKPPRSLPVDENDAVDFLSGLAERQSGAAAPTSELAMLMQLYDASPSRLLNQEFITVDKDRIGNPIETTARLQTAVLGEQIIRSYFLRVAQGFTSGSSLSATLNVGMPRRNNRIYPSANLSMMISDTQDRPQSPADRAQSYESILNGYRDHPEVFFGMLTDAALRLAEISA